MSYQPHALLRLAVVLLMSAAPTALGAAEAADEPGFDLQAHRGGRGLQPENTLTAFSWALTLGVSTLELDCAVTRDGVVVVSHDPRLNRDLTRGANGEFITDALAINALTFAQLQQYDVGRLRPGSAYAARFPDQKGVDGERIPSLRQVFELVRDHGNPAVRLNIETKINPLEPQLTPTPEAFIKALLKEIRRARLQSRISIQSFDWRTLTWVQRLAPELQTVALTYQQPNEDTVQLGKPGASPWLGGLDVDDFAGSLPATVKASGAQVWSPNYLDIDAAAVGSAHALGLRVIPWTVNDPGEMQRVFEMGVDGMISDRPDLLRELLQGHGR